MDGMAASEALSGGLTLTVTTAGGRVADATLRSDRPTAMGRAFVGLDAQTAAHRLPLLFGICGIAQQVAGLTALENARGHGVHPKARRCREIAVLAETVLETARGISLGWSGFTDGKPEANVLMALMSGREKVVTGLSRGAVWRRVGAPEIADGDGAKVADGIAEMETALSGMGVDAPLVSALETGELQAYRDWADGGGNLAARTVSCLFGTGMAGFGAAPFRPLVGGAKSLSDRLALDHDGSFQANPHIAGAPRETGALAAMADQPLVQAVIAAHGHGLLARVTARLAELAATSDKMARLAERLDSGSSEGVAAPSVAGAGAGTGDIRCARGRLVHWAAVDADGRIERYRILAPTEWTFHPGGALVQGLQGQDGADRQDFAKHVALLVAAMDPCVSCGISIREAAHA